MDRLELHFFKTILFILIFFSFSACEKEEIFSDELGSSGNQIDIRSRIEGTYIVGCQFTFLSLSYNSGAFVNIEKGSLKNVMNIKHLYQDDNDMSGGRGDLAEIILTNDSTFIIPRQKSGYNYYNPGNGFITDWGGGNISIQYVYNAATYSCSCLGSKQ